MAGPRQPPSHLPLHPADAPTWVNVVAFLAIAVHMMSAWQVFAQPVSALTLSSTAAVQWCRAHSGGTQGYGGKGWLRAVRCACPPSQHMLPTYMHVSPTFVKIYDTIESWVKAWRMKKEQQAALALGAAQPGAGGRSLSGSRSGRGRPAAGLGRVSMQPSPFDAIAEEEGTLGSKAKTESEPSARSAAAPPGPAAASSGRSGGLEEQEAGATAAEAGVLGGSVSANTVLENGPLGSRLLSLRVSEGGAAVRNSCPIPDLVPPSGGCRWGRAVQCGGCLGMPCSQLRAAATPACR